MKTAKRYTDNDHWNERHWIRTYFGFMLFFALMLMLMLIMVSCSEPQTVYRIEPQLKPYSDYFFGIANNYNRDFERSNLLLKLTSGLQKRNNCVGLTTKITVGGQTGQRTIEFDSLFWMNSTESVRQVLTLHEFGHCFLNRDHNNYYSIMNPVMGSLGWPLCYNVECDHKILLDELFRNAN